MGCFDTVNLRCPHCDRIVEEQTKSGDCMMEDYDLTDAPMNVMAGIIGNVHCYHCSQVFMVEMVTKPTFRVRKLTKEEENGSDGTEVLGG